MVGRESWAAASFFLVVRRLVSISGGGDGRAEFIVIVIVFRPPVGVHLDGDGGQIWMLLLLLLLLAIIVLLFVAFALLLEQRAKERKRLRLEQDKIDDGGRKQLGEDAGASSGALCGDERGGLHAVMAGEGPAGRSIGW